MKRSRPERFITQAGIGIVVAISTPAAGAVQPPAAAAADDPPVKLAEDASSFVLP